MEKRKDFATKSFPMEQVDLFNFLQNEVVKLEFSSRFGILLALKFGGIIEKV